MAIRVNNSEIMTDDKILTVRNLAIDSNGYIGAETAAGPNTSPLLGTNFGYVTGGILPPATLYNIIERFPVTSDANGTDVGDLFHTTRGHSGHSSEIAAFTSTGQIGFTPGIATTATSIQKFPFASTAAATFVGNALNGRYRQQGVSSSTHGYVTLGVPTGILGIGAGPSQVSFTSIEKFPFFSDVFTSYIGDISSTGRSATGAQSSNIAGYITGGNLEPLSPTTILARIEKFPFSYEVGSMSIGDLTQARSFCQGHTSATHGYTSGGLITPTNRYNTIDKFPFSVDANATDVGDLIFTVGSHVGVSSLNFGYVVGGSSPTQSPVITNVIQKFPFATDSNATDIADCVTARVQGADHSD